MTEVAVSSGEALASQATEILFNRGTLVDLYIGKPTFQRKLRPDSLLLADVIDEAALQLGNKRLMPKKALELHVTLEGKARTALSDRSLEFPISGARFVTYAALPALLKRLQDLRRQWNLATEAFLLNYLELRDQQLVVLDDQTEGLMRKQLELMPKADVAHRSAELLEWQDTERAATRKLYPPVNEVPSSFRFSWRMFKVSALEGGADKMGFLDPEEIVRAQDQMRADLQHWVRTAIVEAHKALGDTAKQARELFEKQNKLHPKNLRPLFEAFETFNAIDFTGRSDWRKQIEEAKSKFIQRDPEGNIDMELTASVINSTSHASDEFKKLLSSIGTLAVEQTAIEAGLASLTKVGEFKRLIEV
jgi:hypothetical protein